jgi:hypothetical protein
MLTHSCERAKIVDLFPRTDNTYKNHTRPIPAKAENEKYIPDIKMMLSFHVESVARMSGRISRRSGKNVNKVLPI